MKYIMLRLKQSNTGADFGLIPLHDRSDVLLGIRRAVIQMKKALGNHVDEMRLRVSWDQATLHAYFGRGLHQHRFADAIDEIDHAGCAVVDLPDAYFGDARGAFITVPAEEFMRQRRVHGSIEEVDEMRHEVWIEASEQGLRLAGRMIDAELDFESFEITWAEITARHALLDGADGGAMPIFRYDLREWPAVKNRPSCAVCGEPGATHQQQENQMYAGAGVKGADTPDGYGWTQAGCTHLTGHEDCLLAVQRGFHWPLNAADFGTYFQQHPALNPQQGGGQ